MNGERLNIHPLIIIGEHHADGRRGWAGPSSSRLHQLTGEPLTDEPSFVIVYSIT